jgi:hypothetical protein
MMASASSDDRLLTAIDEAEVAARRSRPLLLIGFVLLIAAFVSLSIYLNNARAAAERARDAAVQEAFAKNSAANAAANSLEAALVSLERGDRETALDILRLAQGKLERVAGSALPGDAANAPQTAAPVPLAQAKVVNVLQQAAAERPGMALPGYPAGKAYDVYIQFAGSITRGKIVSLNQALREAGWDVQGPSGERIATAAGFNEVRYASAADAEAARALASALNMTGIAGRPVEARELGMIRPGTLEVWVSN